jgi:hypothetical protein
MAPGWTANSFPVWAIQVDGGSRFWTTFERACPQRSILLFTLPSRSPKSNSALEFRVAPPRVGGFYKEL